jgi:hypothetical protein
MIQSTVKKTKKVYCSACGGTTLVPVMDLPSFPLTGIYLQDQAEEDTNIDQGLTICEECGHAQLLYSIAPDYIYDQTYTHRSSTSPLATKGNDFFIEFLDRVTEGRTFKKIVEIGCNDLYLLKKIKNKGERLLGVDPIWRDKDHEINHKIKVVGKFVEEVDF